MFRGDASNWSIRNIALSFGAPVIEPPGNNAFIISNSPWTIGGKNGEVIITGEKNNLGGGILIGDNEELSKIQNTKISYLAGNKNNLNSEFLIFGSINFHQTNVEINNVNFENIYSEDAINIFRSSFKITNGDYKNISSDAIDIDITTISISNCKINNSANDGIDSMTSKVKINQALISNSGDKAVSVGENSDVLITDLSGKLLDSKTIAQSQTLNLSIREPAGIYILSIKAEDKKAVIKLIKE